MSAVPIEIREREQTASYESGFSGAEKLTQVFCRKSLRSGPLNHLKEKKVS